MDNIKNRILTEKDFYRYIFREYKPSVFEGLSEDKRFSKDINYSYISRTRCFLVYQRIAQQIQQSLGRKQNVIDFGFFPGTLLRLLKEILKENVACYGAGLKLDKSFQDYITAYVQGCEYTEFDPFYSKGKKIMPLNFDKETFDVVVATEVLEHLISPLELVAEGSRILRKNGIFIVTTPNVSHVGAVLKLICGRSNYERLERSPMNLQNDEWRGHIRFYDKQELEKLFGRYDLHLIHHQYFTELGWDEIQRSLPQKMLYALKKAIWMIPLYREGHFAVFEKI